MFLRDFGQIKSKKFVFKILLFFSYLSLILINKSIVISRPIRNNNLDKEYKISSISFITKAIQKTGDSVVTIETQKFVKNRQFSRNSRIFLDPYFERFFGLPSIDSR